MKRQTKRIDYAFLLMSLISIAFLLNWCLKKDQPQPHPLPLKRYQNRFLHGMMEMDKYPYAVQAAFAEKKYKLAIHFAESIPVDHPKYDSVQKMTQIIKKDLQKKLMGTSGL